MRLTAVVAGTLLTAAGALLPLSAPAAAQTGPAKVSMKSFAFMPAKVTIKAGEAVTWTYDELPTDLGCESPVFQVPGAPVSCPGHSATAVDKGGDGKPLFDSGLHRKEGFPYSFTFTKFTKPGTYHYICVVHGGPAKNTPITMMEGEVIVEAAASTSAGAPAAPQAAPTTGAQVQGASAAAGGGELSNTGGGLALWWGLLPLGTALWLRRQRRS